MAKGWMITACAAILALIASLILVVTILGGYCGPGGFDSGNLDLKDDAVGDGADQIPSKAVPWIEKASSSGKYAYPAAFVAGDMFTESSFTPDQFTGDRNGGTWGLTQINAAEWERIYGHGPNEDVDGNGTPDIQDPLIHAEYAAKLWDDNIDKIKQYKKDNPKSGAAKASDLELLLVAHNAGFGRVESYPEIPDSTRETYIPRVSDQAKKWGDVDLENTDVEKQTPSADAQSQSSESEDFAGTAGPQDEKYPLPKVKDHVKAAGQLLGQKFELKTIGGYRASNSRDPNGHPSGLALDFMTNDLDDGKAVGDKLAKYGKKNAKKLNIKYIIWYQQIWNVDRPDEGWRDMEDRGGPTQNHEDHVHISFEEDGDAPDKLPGDDGADAGGSTCDGDGGAPGGEGGDRPPPGSWKEPGKWGDHDNGKIPVDELSEIPWAKGEYVRSDTLGPLKALNKAFKEEFGTDLGITDSYRDYDEQVATKKAKGNMAAEPGTSKHGWALALDLGTGINDFGTPQYNWMKDNASAYGWRHPDWAEPTGSLPEPWHWEFYGHE